MVMSSIRPRDFVCSTPVRPSQKALFYSSFLLSPIFDEDRIPSREKIPQQVGPSSRQDHGTGQKRSSFDKIAPAANVRNVAYGQKVVSYPPSSGGRKESGTDCRKEEKSPVKNRSHKIRITCHQEKSGERIRNSSERIWQHLVPVASADSQGSVILYEHYKKQAHQTYQKVSQAKRKKEDEEYVSQNRLKGKEGVLIHKERLQRKDTFDNSLEPKGDKEELKGIRSPQKKTTVQNCIESNEKQQGVQESSRRERLSTIGSGREEQKLQAEESFCNIVTPKNNKAQPEVTRSPQRETRQNSENRKGKQQVVRESPQRKQLSTNSEESSGEEEQQSLRESLGKKYGLRNDNTSQKETLRKSMDKNEKEQVVKQRLLKKQSVPDSVKSNTEAKPGEASHGSIKRSKIPRKRRVPRNRLTSKQKEAPQAVGESPQKKHTSQNSINSKRKEDSEESFCNTVTPKNNKVQPEVTRSPQRETRQNSENRKGKQQVVRESPQRKQLSTNSEESSGEEEEQSQRESLGKKYGLRNDNTSQKETLRKSMDRNEKEQVVKQRLLKKPSVPGSVKSNTEAKPGEASHSSIKRSKIPWERRVLRNRLTSKQKEAPQAVGESPQKKHTSQNSINCKRKEDTETRRKNPRRKHISQNNIQSETKEVPRRVRGRLRKESSGEEEQQSLRESLGEKYGLRNDNTSPIEEIASPNSMLSKGKEDAQGLMGSQKKTSQNRIIRRKEKVIPPKIQALQDSKKHEGGNEPQIEDNRSHSSEELVRLKNRKKTQLKGHVSKSKRKKVVQGPSQRANESQNKSQQNMKSHMSVAEKEDIPGSSSRDEMIKSINASSTSKLKSSHPTYKTARRRRQKCMETLAQFLNRSRYSIEYNPFRDGQKFIAPSEDDRDLRRSKRTRVKPLDFWKGERCLYKPSNCGQDFVGISSSA